MQSHDYRHRRAGVMPWRAFVRALTVRSVLLRTAITLLLFVAMKWMVGHLAAVCRPIQIVLASGGADAIAAGILVAVVSAVFHAIDARAQRRLREAAKQQWQLEALGAENAAVVQVCQTVALAFAQPLSGVLAYSELLSGAACHTEAQRYEVKGVREGALQLAWLLETLRTTAQEAPSAGGNIHVASNVAHAILQPHPRRFRRVRTQRVS